MTLKSQAERVRTDQYEYIGSNVLALEQIRAWMIAANYPAPMGERITIKFLFKRL